MISVILGLSREELGEFSISPWRIGDFVAAEMQGEQRDNVEALVQGKHFFWLEKNQDPLGKEKNIRGILAKFDEASKRFDNFKQQCPCWT